MKIRFSVLISALLLVGCSSQPPTVYFAERPHVQTNDRHPSNLFPSATHHDSYFWYQRNAMRNVRLGSGGESSSSAPETSAPTAAPSGGGNFRGYGGFGYGGYYPPPVYYQPAFRYPVFY